MLKKNHLEELLGVVSPGSWLLELPEEHGAEGGESDGGGGALGDHEVQLVARRLADGGVPRVQHQRDHQAVERHVLRMINIETFITILRIQNSHL